MVLIRIVDAPKDAQTFDKMLIVYSDFNKIRHVAFFSSKENRIVAEFS
jgi:hypothetical protein